MLILSDLDDKDRAALTEFVEKLKAGKDPKTTSPEPRTVLPDGVDFGDGKRWDNPQGIPGIKR